MTTPVGAFGPPPDPVAWAALALSILSFGAAARADAVANFFASPRRFPATVVALAAAAALLSAGYVAYYLRGGPRIVDATSYYLQARAFAGGHVAFDVPSPTASFRGRFLLASPDGHSLATIFPPGYPAVLALGFLAGAPMLVGPVIAAFLVVATAALARRAAADHRTALLAALLSVLCGALRYHTADTMSHGWSALLFAVAAWGALGDGAVTAAIAGASAGTLFATRPVTGAVALALCLLASRRSARHALAMAIAALPPIALFFAEQRVATGAWFHSTQTAYYALADTPPGCLRYGFGAGIGCRFEHGDFVHAHLENGYGLAAALGTTLRRLALHFGDAANLELFAPLVVAASVSALRTEKVRLFALAPLAVIFAYVPFYFDGNYPGGGARFFADVLPFEHVLLALALLRHRLARFAPAVALLGFAFHASHAHGALRDREGGRPMYEPGVVAAAGVSRGLVFVDTDHGFSLGHDPSSSDPSRGVVVARLRRDARDALLWDRLGRPPAFVYEYVPRGEPSTPRLVPLALAIPNAARFEAEAEFPALAVRGGSAVPTFPACASNQRALRLEPDPGGNVAVRLELPSPGAGRYRVRTAWARLGPAVDARVRVGAVEWQVPGPADGNPPCFHQDGPPLHLSQVAEYMNVSVSSPIELDYAELVPVD